MSRHSEKWYGTPVLTLAGAWYGTTPAHSFFPNPHEAICARQFCRLALPHWDGPPPTCMRLWVQAGGCWKWYGAGVSIGSRRAATSVWMDDFLAECLDWPRIGQCRSFALEMEVIQP